MDKLFRTPEEIYNEFLRQEREEEEGLEVGGSESEDEDNEEVSDHESESEQEADEDDSSNEEADSNDYFLSKDESIKWKKKLPRKTIRTRGHNIITHLPGRKTYSKHVSTILEAFYCFFDDHIFKMILDNTNFYIDNMKKNYSRDRDCKNTNMEELEAFLGLLYLAGLHRAAHVNYEDLRKDINSFGITMSSARFLFLLRVIRFDNISTREERKKIDKLAPVRDLLNAISDNYKKAYSPGEYLTIDEQLVPFRGKCAFRQYLPRKPKRYGIKVFAMVDARMSYLINFEVYVGTQPEGPFRVDNSVLSIVDRLIEPVQGTNRNITTDNWYTSVPLAQHLLKNKKLTLVGTLRKNKREIPKNFQPNKAHKLYSSQFGFTEDITLLSYVPKKNKAVIMLSTMHHDANIDLSTESKSKPEIVTFYNCTKSGVDTCDQMCSNFNVGRRTRRWPLAIFFHFMNVTAINALTIYNSGRNSCLEKRNFLRQLGESLLEKHIRIRQCMENIPRPLKKKIKLYFGESAETYSSREAGSSSGATRGRCKMCSRKDDKKPSQKCSKCKNFICKLHSEIICLECMEDSD